MNYCNVTRNIIIPTNRNSDFTYLSGSATCATFSMVSQYFWPRNVVVVVVVVVFVYFNIELNRVVYQYRIC